MAKDIKDIQYQDEEFQLRGSGTFTREGYAFAGWFVNGKTYQAGERITLTSDTYVIAQWTKGCKVTFDPNGGDNPTPFSEAYYMYGEPYSPLPSCGRDGYTHLGWFTSKTGGTQVLTTTQVLTREDHTLYAHWNLNTYTHTLRGKLDNTDMIPDKLFQHVTSAKCNGENMEQTIYGYSYGETIQPYLPFSITINTDTCKVIGGSEVTESTKPTYETESTSSPRDFMAPYVCLQSLTTTKKYYVTFNPTEGTGTAHTQTIERDVPTQLTTNSFTHTTKMFAGWSTTSTGYVEYLDQQVVTNIAEPNATIQLYAVWSAILPYITLQFSVANNNGDIACTTSPTGALRYFRYSESASWSTYSTANRPSGYSSTSTTKTIYFKATKQDYNDSYTTATVKRTESSIKTSYICYEDGSWNWFTNLVEGGYGRIINYRQYYDTNQYQVEWVKYEYSIS